MKTKYSQFLLFPQPFRSYPMSVMFSYCLIGSSNIGSFFCFCPNQNLPERPPPWLRPEEERKVLLPPPEEEEELCTRRLRVVEYR